jgi:hypothetical protein
LSPSVARRDALLGILRRQHPQQEHPPRLRPGHAGNSWHGARTPASRRLPACSLCTLPPISSSSAGNDRHRPSNSASSQSVTCSIGLWGPGYPCKFGRFRARAVAQREARQDAGALQKRALLDSIDVTTPAALRDRALIGLMVYSFARVGGARHEGPGRLRA